MNESNQTTADQPQFIITRAFYESSISHERADSLFRFLVELGYSVKVTQSGGTFTIEGELIQVNHPTDRPNNSDLGAILANNYEDIKYL